MRLRVFVIAAVVLTMGAISLQAQNNCTPLTQGFWKNHVSAWSDGGGMMLGNTNYTNAQLVNILKTPVRGDASLSLAHQLIAANLNIAAGTDATPIQTVLADANSLLGSGTIPEGISPSSSVGQQMEYDASILDDFNNGDITTSCGELPQAVPVAGAHEA